MNEKLLYAMVCLGLLLAGAFLGAYMQYMDTKRKQKKEHEKIRWGEETEL